MIKTKPTIIGRHPVFITSVFFLILFFTGSASAITIKNIQLSGTTLSLDGREAASNTVILVDGVAVGNADNRGRYALNVTAYSSTTCIVQVSDGFTSTSSAIPGCTPASTLPPPTENSAPVANAGVNVTVQDTDLNGVEMIILDGSASSDPDGTVVSWLWSESGLQIGSGVSTALAFSLGAHTVELTVTDDQGASAVDTIIISVVAESPPPPPSSPKAISLAACCPVSPEVSSSSLPSPCSSCSLLSPFFEASSSASSSSFWFAGGISAKSS